jgi:hypothetical protein
MAESESGQDGGRKVLSFSLFFILIFLGPERSGGGERERLRGKRKILYEVEGVE